VEGWLRGKGVFQKGGVWNRCGLSNIGETKFAKRHPDKKLTGNGDSNGERGEKPLQRGKVLQTKNTA